MTWWRSRYVQHLESENAELRETVKRMLNPQWRYLLYGTEVEACESVPRITKVEDKPNVKIPRYSWRDFAAKAEELLSPQHQIDERRKQHEEHLHAVSERIG